MFINRSFSIPVMLPTASFWTSPRPVFPISVSIPIPSFSFLVSIPSAMSVSIPMLTPWGPSPGSGPAGGARLLLLLKWGRRYLRGCLKGLYVHLELGDLALVLLNFDGEISEVLLLVSLQLTTLGSIVDDSEGLLKHA